MMKSPTVFKKFLSLNDTGETGANMGGILIPRSEIDFFPKLDPHQKNPREEILAIDEEGQVFPLTFTYYNNSFFGGTRDEFRLTGLSSFFSRHRVNAGDTLIIEKFGSDHRIRSEKPSSKIQALTDPKGPPSNPVTPILRTAQHEHSIRPAARIIHTIGQNLIKDPQAAVIELVKNAYDADAKEVTLSFRLLAVQNKKTLSIVAKDSGHGMTYQKVIDSWLVPATTDKIERRQSPNGRQLQGNKGIGRFAAFMLGEEIFLQTVAEAQREETSLLLKASDFRGAGFLDEVLVLVETRHLGSDSKAGTTFEMLTFEDDPAFHIWTGDDFSKLRLDLRRMLFPLSTRHDEFRVFVEYDGFESNAQPNGREEIEPLPIIDHFDYRIRLDIDNSGTARGTFESPLLIGKSQESVELSHAGLPGQPCGRVTIDIRVIDREPNSLQQLLDRSKASGEALDETNRAQLRKLLDEASGISVFRGNFRIRPYGDSGDDWLELDKKRINNPSLYASNNQTFGVITIAPEEESRLEETSARDGLRQDAHYIRLKALIGSAMMELQRRRFAIRRSIGRIQRGTKVDELLNALKDYEKPFQEITSVLRAEKVDLQRIERIRQILRSDQETRNEIVQKLEQEIAMYQGQATLGKMVGVLLHEGNRSLGILRTQGRRIPEWMTKIETDHSLRAQTEVVQAMEGIRDATDTISTLFARIEPLGIRNRGKAKPLRLLKPIQATIKAFENKLADSGIKVELQIRDNFQVVAWEMDLQAVFLNLIENSIYWLSETKAKKPLIRFWLDEDEDGVRLNIADNGPGIPKEHIANQDIFEPHFSLRGGTGIGLPIAGEAAARNNFVLYAVQPANGAHFILDFNPALSHA